MLRLLLSVISLIPMIAYCQAGRIFIDGNTTDWQACTNKYNDEAGDGNSIDILQLRVMNDDQYLYLAIKTYEEFQLSQDNPLTLLIDGDNNSETGFQFNGIGAELKWEFGRRRGTFYANGNSTTVWHDNIGLYALPTVTAKEFEIAVGRSVQPDGSNHIFTSSTIKILVYDNTSGDILPENGDFIVYNFDETTLPPVEAFDVSRKDAKHLRLMTWNILQDGITDPDRSESFERILTALSPDVITFNEAWDTQASTIKNMLNRLLPLNNEAGWQAHKLVDGNITASRYSITKSYDVVPGKRLMASLINLPDEIYTKDFVVFNCHLKCCNSDGDNETRQYEIESLMTFVKNMKEGNSVFAIESGTPFVFMGDMNLVGTSQNLATMIYGIDGEKPDWDHSGMEDDIARNVTSNMAYTFTEEGTSYWPGRLDYILFTGSQLKLQKSFIFESTIMAANVLNQIGVYRTDNANASDHLPHVADFTIEAASNNNLIVNEKIKLYPNPANDIVCIDGLSGNDYNSFTVFDFLGIKQMNGSISQSANTIYLSTNTLSSGVYTVFLKSTQGKTISLKLIVQK